MDSIEYGLCKCGCGQKTKIAKQTNTKRGWVRGEPYRFIQGHYAKLNPTRGQDSPLYGKKGKDNPNWKGGRTILKRGNTSYVLIYTPDHPRCHTDGRVYEHIVVVEEAWGYPLPNGSVVHHVDGNGLNNELSNLMVFSSQADHMRWHAL